MRKSLILKSVFLLLIFSFMMFYSPHLLVSKTSNKGDLIGFIYGEDGTTPLGRGTVKIRNISTNTVYESTKSDNVGLFRIGEIEGGLYTAAISTNKGNFTARNLIGVKTNETAKVSFALEVKGSHKEEMQPFGDAIVIASSHPIMYNSLVLTGNIQGEEEGEDKDDKEGEDKDDQGEDEDDQGEDEDDPSNSKPKKPKKPKDPNDPGTGK